MKSCLPISLMVAWAWLAFNDGLAQNTFKPLARTFSVGITASHYDLDPSLGFEIGTPTFSKERFCVRVKGNINWLEQYKADLDKWVHYNSFSISLVYNTQVTDRSRFYFDVGAFVIVPNTKFAASKTIEGISGIAGVEIFFVTNPNLNVSYYFGGGYSYPRAYADKMEGRPHYGTGIIFNNGVRFYINSCKASSSH